MCETSRPHPWPLRPPQRPGFNVDAGELELCLGHDRLTEHTRRHATGYALGMRAVPVTHASMGAAAPASADGTGSTTGSAGTDAWHRNHAKGH
eukprot:5658781-Prymnesium_polylepis.1